MLDAARGIASASFVATLSRSSMPTGSWADWGSNHTLPVSMVPSCTERSADKVDLLADLLAIESISPECAVMIGDRAVDIVSARAHRIRSIGVLWGCGSESELTAAGADGLCGAPAELVAWLGRLAS
jgi:hypothetical protein